MDLTLSQGKIHIVKREYSGEALLYMTHLQQCVILHV